MYMRRAGTSGISGQLYESKLISLLYFRAFHDHTIEDFQIAANVDNIGQFDDICFKFKAKEFDKPVAVFIQARHRVKGKITFARNDLAEYFYSYCKIRRQFDPSNKDSFFNGTFNNTECIFVIYTNATIDPMMTIKHSGGSGFNTKLYNLIETGGTVKQPCKYEEIIKDLCKVTMKEQMTALAYRIANCIVINNGNGQMLLTDEIVQRFHVILARQVFDVSEIQPDGYRFAAFRHDFFDTHEEYLTIFKDALFKEIIKLRKIPQLEQDYFSELTVHRAEELAVKQTLLSSAFKVPSAFGNKDLTISNNPKKRDRRIMYIASKIINVLDMCKPSKIVTIDESLEDGLLQLNGGIAGAIGNIFVLDDNTKLMKITDNSEQLGPLANMLYIKLNSGIHNLHEYKFCFKDNKFAMLSFDCSNYEENLVRDFLDRLMFYSHQADEYEVEKILKSEIEYYQSNQPNYFQAKTDAIFSNFHDQVQKWWMQPRGARYLTGEFNIFQESINNIIKDPLMSSINLTYMNKMHQYNYTFTEDAVSSLNLLNDSSIIITENSLLTVVKVLQYLKNQDHVVLDFEYIAHLPTNDLNGLFSELRYTDQKRILILVYDKTYSSHDMKHLQMIARTVRWNQTIVVTNQTSFEIIRKYFPDINTVIQDKKLSLIDLSVESQMSIIENASAMFPGVEIKLDILLKGWSKTGSRLSCVTAPRARQQSEVDGASTSQESSAAAAADSETGKPFLSRSLESEGSLSRQTGEEEKNVPGMSSDPL